MSTFCRHRPAGGATYEIIASEVVTNWRRQQPHAKAHIYSITQTYVFCFNDLIDIIFSATMDQNISKDIGSFTINQLKMELEKRGLRKSGRKSDLIER